MRSNSIALCLLLGMGFVPAADAACTAPSGTYSGAGGGVTSLTPSATTVPLLLAANQEMMIDNFTDGGTATLRMRVPYTIGAAGMRFTATTTIVAGTIKLNGNLGPRCRGTLTFNITTYQECVGTQACVSTNPPTAAQVWDYISTNSGNSVQLINQDPANVNVVAGGTISLAHP